MADEQANGADGDPAAAAERELAAAAAKVAAENVAPENVAPENVARANVANEGRPETGPAETKAVETRPPEIKAAESRPVRARPPARIAAVAPIAVAAKAADAVGSAVQELSLSTGRTIVSLEQTTTTTATPTMERIMTTAEDLMAFGQGNIEAFVKAGQIWAAGLQDLGKTLADSAQAQIEQNVTAFKALAGVKSLREAMDLQSTHARAALEKVVADSGKLTDASLKLAEQTLAPLTARMSVAAERFTRTA